MESIMKRFLILLLALLMAASLLASCTERNPSGDDPDNTGELNDLIDSISQAVADGELNLPSALEVEILIKENGDTAEVIGCKNAVGAIEIPSEFNGKKVTKIADGAFSGMLNIKSVKIPDSVTEIGRKAFFSCTALTGITIPDSVKKIGDYAFYGCSKLEVAIVGSGVTEIGSRAFNYCRSLTKITVDGANKFYTDIDGVLYTADKSVLLAYPAGISVAEYTVPAGVTTIANFAFAYANNLSSVTVADSVSSLGDYTFSECSKLENVKLGSGLTFIGASSFDKCVALKSIVIPEGVTSIGYVSDGNEVGGSFAGCTALAEITLPSTLKNIYAKSFSDCTALKTVKFAGSESAWKAVKVGSDNAPISTASVSYAK